jgi:hypothetical protein
MAFSRFEMLVALIWLWWGVTDSLLSCLCWFHTHSFLCFRSAVFFLSEVKCWCLAICSVMRLSSFYLVTEVTGVRLERNVLQPASSDTASWLAGMAVTSTYWSSSVEYYLGTSALPWVQFRSVQKVKLRADKKWFTKFISTLKIGIELQNEQFNTV